MAEAVSVFGLAGSIIQLIDFSCKVVKRLHDFRSSLNECSNTFGDLIVFIPLWENILAQLRNLAASNHLDEQTLAVLLPMLKKCAHQVKRLEEILSNTIPNEGDTSFDTKRKAFYSLSREKKVKKSAENLHRTLQPLMLFVYLPHLSNQLLNRVATLEEAVGTMNRSATLDGCYTRQLSPRISQPDAVEIVVQRPPENNNEDRIEALTRTRQPAKKRSIYSQRLDALCLSDRCTCSCHTMLSKSGRFWFWKFPSLPKLFSACDRKTCGNKIIRTSFHVCLSRINILQAIDIGLRFGWGESGCTISLTLRPARIVKFTSPGFTLLWECETGQLRWQEAKKKLVRLLDEKEASLEDVDPSGETWLEKLLKYPWCVGAREAQFGLLEMLIEHGATLDTNSSLLCLCAGWIGEGPHLSAVETLLDHGYDVSLVNSQSLSRWPQGSNPGWLGEDITPDPFFIELVGKCVENDPDFGDTTLLMEAVLIGSAEDVAQHLSKSSDVERNFLGQSALHLSILRPKILRMLISTYENLDLPDKNGTTPLMYAAAYSKAESVLLLLDHGADWIIRDGLRRRNFLEYALVREAWSLIAAVANYFKQHVELEEYQILVDYIMQVYVITKTNRFPESHFQDLFSLGVDPNMILDDETTLLHHVREIDEVKLLFQAGFELINHRDNKGVTPLMRTVRLKNAALVEACLCRGASVNMQDNQGWTALHHISEELRDSTSASFHYGPSADEYLLRHSELVNTIRLLLQYGADPAAGDHCVCACSLSGCTPSAVLLGKKLFSFFPTDGDLWSLEWLQTSSELGSKNIAEQTLLNLVRVKQFKVCELTHVCCQRGPFSHLDEDDIDEILDEENEGIQELDEMMQHYLEGGQGNVEERWIERLSLHSAPEGERIRRHKRPHEVISITSDPAADGTKSLMPFNRYSIDTIRDEFVKNLPEFTRSLPKQINVKDYIIWLDYYYNHRLKLSTPSAVDATWYRARKAMASRLEIALWDASTSAQEEVR